jgi:hypothetical protein
MVGHQLQTSQRTMRSGTDTSHSGCSFEQTFWIIIVVLVQSPDGDRFRGTPQLTYYIAVVCVGPGLQANPLYAHSCRLVRKRWGVCISATANTERIRPR